MDICVCRNVNLEKKDFLKDISNLLQKIGLEK
jgi:hypothetical protein